MKKPAEKRAIVQMGAHWHTELAIIAYFQYFDYFSHQFGAARAIAGFERDGRGELGLEAGGVASPLGDIAVDEEPCSTPTMGTIPQQQLQAKRAFYCAADA